MGKELDPEALLSRRIVLFRGEIHDSNATEIIARMLYLQHQDRYAEIHLHIDSKGGCVSAGFAIADTIREIVPAVRTFCTREACGTAAVILAAGKKGLRFVHPESVISLTPMEIGNPNGASVDESERELRKWRFALADLLVSYTGKPRDVVLNDLQHGRSFDASQAIQYGIVDQMLLVV